MLIEIDKSIRLNENTMIDRRYYLYLTRSLLRRGSPVIEEYREEKKKFKLCW